MKWESKYTILSLANHPHLKEEMARWFHEKWGIPYELYLESMTATIKSSQAVPQWYVAVEGPSIIGGVGVIANDFHPRSDLTPNLCALYVEEGWRGQGVAGALLDFAVQDMKEQGIDTLYLVTDHTTFYERYGWTYLCPVQCDGEDTLSRMYVHKIQ